jgi:hypothetical protein
VNAALWRRLLAELLGCATMRAPPPRSTRPASDPKPMTTRPAAAAFAATALDADAEVATQGHALAAGDFLATLAVEATIHHLDLVAEDQDLAGPSGPGLAVARETVDGILGQPVRAGWDDVGYALRAGGRMELTADDRACLGALAGRFPLIG